MNKIAIIGLAGFFPGATTASEYWHNLLDGKNSKTKATIEQMGVDPAQYFSPEKGTPDKYYCMNGGYIHDFEFDASGYQLAEDYLEKLDDLFKWSLYVSKEALKDSGYLDQEEILSQCGVILGNLSFPTKYSNHLCVPIYHKAVEASLRQYPNNEKFTLKPFTSPISVSDDNLMISGYPSAVIARALSLSGPYFSLDAACASSIYAVKFACDCLLSGRADMMLAGAVSAADPFFINMGFSIFQAYPENDISAPFDRESRGLMAGEGAGMFVLKRYDDALRDGDKIYAAILGIGLSNDGRGQSVLSPGLDGQNTAYERAYANAGVDPKDISFLECHATGTPLGDKVELDSIDTFFGKHGASPLVGSSKSNLGHLLTAAGMAGMIKTVFSMSHDVIPGTIGLRETINSKNNVISTNQIPAVNTPWPVKQEIKHAAVSGFGFGGTNAHIIFEHRKFPSNSEGKTHHSKRKKAQIINLFDEKRNASKEPFSLAITGMDAIFGECRGLLALHRTTYAGSQHFNDLPENRWKGIENYKEILKSYGFDQGIPPKGAYVDRFDLDFLGFKIPPNKNDRLIPQQLITLKVADKSLRDAGIEQGSNVAVIVAMGAELTLHQFRGRVNLETQLDESLKNIKGDIANEQATALKDNIKQSIHGVAMANQYTSFIGNVMASRISSIWDFSGPAFTVSSEENSTFKAIDIARMLLENREAEAVVVAAVDFSGGFENVLLKNKTSKVNTGSPSLSFNKDTSGWIVGEGAGAIVLKRSDDALKDKSRIYALIQSLSFTKGNDHKSVSTACQKAFRNAGIHPKDIAYLEVHGSGIKREDDAEIKGLIDAYQSAGQEPTCAIGSIKANIGHTFSASGMASLIKTALCLNNRFIPCTPGWSSPKYPEKWKKSPFFVPTQSRTWFKNGNQKKRIAAINSMGADYTCCHLILSDEPKQAKLNNDYLTAMPMTLMPLAADSQENLYLELEDLLTTLDADQTITITAGKFFRRFKDRAALKYRLAIVGKSKNAIYDEIEYAKKGIKKAFDKNGEWISEKGSAFTCAPLGEKGKIAFVYPGGYNSYIGLGKNLFQLFPEVYERAGSYISSLDEIIGNDLLHPKSMNNPNEEELKVLSKSLFNNSALMFESGIMSGILYTDIIRESFQVSPDQALGYSMGEITMLFALGVWEKSDKIRKVLQESQVYGTRVLGSMDNVKDAWNLSASETRNKKFWYSYKLETSPNQVRKALEKDLPISKGKSAYLIFVNTPNEVVIAGYDQACKRVIKDLGCHYFEVPVSDAIHSELVKPDFEALINMHRLPVNEVPEIDFYSAFNFAPLVMDSDVIAKNVADIYTHEIDFQKLIEKAYENGGRIFIELGPRNNCTTWIDEILKDKKHLAVATNKKDINEHEAILQIIAALFSHRVKVDLSPLYVQSRMKSVSKRLLVKSITLGGNSIGDEIITENNKKLFKSLQIRQIEKDPLIMPASVTIEKKDHINPSVAFDDPFSETDRRFNDNISILSASHKAFLSLRSEGAKQISYLITHQLAMLKKESATPESVHNNTHHVDPNIEQLPQSSLKQKEMALSQIQIAATQEISNVIWDQNDLLEFAQGSIANVFGNQYAIIDTYKRRVRLPMNPYLLVSRVTKLNATCNEFKPSSMTTEFDIPKDFWCSIDGQVPWAVSVESGQCDLLLISYLGVDFMCKGDRVYRLLDCTLTFLENIPMEGETLRYDISINSYARNGDSLLFFFSYKCFVGNVMVLKMDGGCAGFFTDAELDSGKGIAYSEEENKERALIEKKSFKPFLTCRKNSFEREALLMIINGNRGACFGPGFDQDSLNPSLKFATEKMLMIDRVRSIDLNGGIWGLGLVIAEKALTPDAWYFVCHFKDDQVMAGSLMAEGCSQLLQFFLIFMGMHTQVKDARFQPIRNLPQKVRCRGQVLPKDRLLTYRMEVKEIGLKPYPYAIADIDILVDEKIVVDFKNLGVQLVEKKDGDPYKINTPEGHFTKTRDPKPLFDKTHFEHFATGSLSECFGPEFAIYEGRHAPRTPNTELQLTSRVIEISGERHDLSKPAFAITEYDVPEDAWYYQNNANNKAMPYSIIMEIALQPCGFISAYMGTTLLYPDTDFFFRNLDGKGRIYKDMDLRGRTIKNKATLLSTASMGNTIIQSFTFEMTVEGHDFYKGTAVFGYFVASALKDQIGIDSGLDNHPMTEKKYLTDVGITVIDLKSSDARTTYYEKDMEKPWYRLAGPQLDFLNSVQIVEDGGRHGLGYIYAERKIDKNDWYFKCHFFQDPVMPGSLGIESVMQALQIFALKTDLGKEFKSPKFTHIEDTIIWKYRGQINPEIESMAIEVHITKIEIIDHKVVVTGDASLWKEKIRIYEIKEIGLCIEEGECDE
jgi:PfaB family protein